MKLEADAFPELVAEPGFFNLDFEGICSDSRKVKQGDLFVAYPSSSTAPEKFIEQAVSAGAIGILSHRSADGEVAKPLGVPFASTNNEFELTAGKAAKVITKNPSAQLKVIGVTGTNGKTTTSWILAQMLRTLGTPCAYLGTLGYSDADGSIETNNTTPFSVETWNLLGESVSRGNRAIVMEVSSHSLAQYRVEGIEFDAGIFTNLTQDHLDFHQSMENYEAAKFRLFNDLPKASPKRFVAVLNEDDSVGKSWCSKIQSKRIRFSHNRPMKDGTPGRLVGHPESVRVDQIELGLSFADQSVSHASTRLGGMYNVENVLAAIGGLLALGYSFEQSAQALAKVNAVPGRFEPVTNSLGIGVLVDYAHTPDALEKLLISVRELSPNRIITVFGCGGDRDKTKRPLMAAVASELSDLVIVTSDNPRTEDPAAILADVVAGIKPGSRSSQVIDRIEAIQAAIQEAEPGDVVVIAGKGHEDYQIIGREKIHMDDRELARGFLGDRERRESREEL